MFKIEEHFIDFVKKRSSILFFAVITVISCYIRILGADFLSGDMYYFLLPWYDKIQAGGGFASLGAQVGDYNLLYQTVIAALTYIDAPPIYLYKLFSVIFDYALAFTAAFGLMKMTGRGFGFFNAVYTTVLFLPTVVLNGAYWGQCDGIYTFFVLLFLFSLYSEKYLRAFIFLGLAFGFKFQAIFILPFAVAYYFYKKKFSILYFGVSAIAFWLTGIVGFIYGRGLLEPFKLYFMQTARYRNMWKNFTSFWRILGDDYDSFSGLAVLLTLVICGLGLYAVLRDRKRMDTPEQFFNLAAWFAWTMVLFLPAMHERYAYMLDILLILLSFINARYIKYALLSFLLGLATYGDYLVGIGVLDMVFVFAHVLAYAYFGYEIFVKENASAKQSIT